jgi:enamine deaminase RidA (YjgF/YER057c/UK114 family)
MLMTGHDSPLEFLHPRHWKRARGYNNGVAARGRLVFIAGQIGWNADQQFESQDFVAQVRQALENVVAVVAEAGGTPAHIVRLTWFITDKGEYLSRLPEVGEAYRSVMGKHYPAMTVVEVSALMEDEAKVEIEASAVVPHIGRAHPIGDSPEYSNDSANSV